MFYHLKERVQRDGNNGTPYHGLDERKGNPVAPGNQQEMKIKVT
jgi:hypothetical protein